MWPNPAASCPTDFPNLWHSFVDTFIDVLHAQGPAAPRQPHHTQQQPPHVLPAVPRLVAIGDLHGDLRKARIAFRLAGLIDDQDRWAGGTTTAVQVGDLLDRGDQELPLLYFLERVRGQAAAAGGALHVLNGNHETMNVAGQFRYVTHRGMNGFTDWLQGHTLEAALKAKCGCQAAASGLRHLLRHQREQQQQHLKHTNNSNSNSGSDSDSSGSKGSGKQHRPPNLAAAARVLALQPGGEVTKRFLAANPVVLQVGSTLFVHGGVLSQHVDYGLDRINKETQEWMLRGVAGEKPRFLSGRNAVVWSRHYSDASADRCDCDQLGEVLGRVAGAQRMVVGHTIQESGITSACQGRVLRIDVGLSRGCGNGSPEVLEIVNDSVVRRLSETQQENAVPATQQQQPPTKTAIPEDKKVATTRRGSTEAAEAQRPAVALQSRQQAA